MSIPTSVKGGIFQKIVPVRAYLYEGATAMVIETLEGELKAEPGDWIITGVAGEIYPCKPEIFSATYALMQSDENLV